MRPSQVLGSIRLNKDGGKEAIHIGNFDIWLYYNTAQQNLFEWLPFIVPPVNPIIWIDQGCEN